MTNEELKAIIDALPETICLVENIAPNKWNFNEQTAEQMSSLKYSKKKYGEIYPVLIRDLGNGKFEIIDGEHRWKASKDLGEKSIKVKNLGQLSDGLAKELMVILNETRGNPDQAELAEMVQELQSKNKNIVLPYTEKFIEQLKRMAPVEVISKEVGEEEFDAIASTTKQCYDGHNFQKVRVRTCKKCQLVEILK